MLDKHDLTYLELLDLRTKIVESYFQVYNDFKIEDSVNLDEDKDITLDFVNCTICLAKRDLYNGIIGNNYVMLQPCLRNNHINLLSSYSEQSNYLSYFTMLGGFCYINNGDNWVYLFNKILMRQFKFFMGLVNDREVKLTIPIQYSNVLKLSNDAKELLYRNNGKIIYSSKDGENLKWKYGIDGIIGYGTRWEIKNINGVFINCGNDILLFDSCNKAVGIDFGSGLETLVSLSNGYANLLYSNKVCSDYVKEFCNGNSLNEKLIDSLLSLICCRYYKRDKNVRIKYLIYNYMRIISAISIINDIDNETLISLMMDICKNIGINDNNIIFSTIDDVGKQRAFLYEISASDSVFKAIKNIQRQDNKYERKLFNIEIYALKKIIEEGKTNDKTKKIKKR